MIHPLLQLILLAVLLAAAMTDLKSFKIPNWLTMSAMAIGLLGHTFVDGISGLLFSLKGLGLGLTLFMVLYVMGGIGAGDVKLLAAVGSFVGAEGVLSAGLIAMLLGGLYAIAIMVSHWGMRGSLTQMATIIKTSALMPTSFESVTAGKSPLHLRYALVIGLGTLMSQQMVTPFFSF
jgi:prepilin peptidase CpaA